MQIYIAGQITGLEFEAAFHEFETAERTLAALGHTPLNPMKIVDQDDEREYETLLLDALEIVVTSAQAMYMLPNWRVSRGARIEHAIAEEYGMPIYYAATGVPENK